MEEIIETTPEAEVIAPTTEPTVENAPVVEVEQTISEMLPEVEQKKNQVPESVFLAEKKARKELEKELVNLKKQYESGDVSNREVSSSINFIAEKHNIDKEFLGELISVIKSDTEKELENKFNSKFESKEKVEKFETAFNKGLALALERGPEFKDVVNTDVVRQLATLPQNASKTISQIIEETYGNALQGKRTIETSVSPKGGQEPEPLDIERANKDIKYLTEILSDPKKKEQYNASLLSKGF